MYRGTVIMASTQDEADIDNSTASGNPLIDGLLSEFHWSLLARENFQFTMPDDDSDFRDTRDLLINDYPDNNYLEVFTMPLFMQSAIRAAISEYNLILNFTISEQGDNDVDTQLRYSISDLTNTKPTDTPPAYGNFPYDDSQGEENPDYTLDELNWMSGDIFFNVDNFLNADNALMVGTYQYHTILHETGHALGLKHGHSTDFGRNALPTAFDSMEFSVMTYRGFIGEGLKGGYQVRNGDYAQTLMMLDIQALQYIYGADYTTHAGSTTYEFATDGTYTIDDVDQWRTRTGTIFLTIWDGGGEDTYDFSAFAGNQQIDLEPGGWTNVGSNLARLGKNFATDPLQLARGNVFNALMFNDNTNSLIENAIGGSGNDSISGNIKDNKLVGGGGGDSILGKIGQDTLTGGDGDDELFGGTGRDLLIGGRGGDLLNGGDDFDTVVYNSSAGETVTITPTGNPKDGVWNVTGPDQAAGDILARIESFKFGNGSDTVTLVNGKGQTAVWIDGSGGDDRITGSAGATDKDFLIGGAGSDTLEVQAGSFEVYGGSRTAGGADWIEKASDNDLLILDRSGYGANYTLFRLSEGLELGKFFSFDDNSTARGIARVHYTGSDFSDTVDGGVRDDILLGGGGSDNLLGGDGNDFINGQAGIDSLSGGDGDDTIIGNLGDNTIFGGAGDDTINCPGAAALGGLGNDVITGGDFDERFEGNEDNDRLNGGGGVDQLVGGPGNDTIEGGSGGDFLGGGGDIDELSYSQSNARVIVNLQTLTATGGDATGDVISDFENLAGSKFNDQLTGNDGQNRLKGDLGNDQLTGGGGNDRLFGGGGDDRFIFGNQNFGKDQIADFENGADRIDLRGSGLTFASFTEAQVGTSTVLTLIGNADVSITLLKTDSSTVTQADFLV